MMTKGGKRKSGQSHANTSAKKAKYDQNSLLVEQHTTWLQPVHSSRKIDFATSKPEFGMEWQAYHGESEAGSDSNNQHSNIVIRLPLPPSIQQRRSPTETWAQQHCMQERWPNQNDAEKASLNSENPIKLPSYASFLKPPALKSRAPSSFLDPYQSSDDVPPMKFEDDVQDNPTATSPQRSVTLSSGRPSTPALHPLGVETIMQQMTQLDSEVQMLTRNMDRVQQLYVKRLAVLETRVSDLEPYTGYDVHISGL
ncbi:hypothetical protein K461DRAFT_317618 [Myriangium duriaei CBS 260.36]|uniref:Uncharacterized protein n=1 Tax=Myriangium duriaei CBS 260.36 TaxID=1168546 RepID=A0A9P4JBE0_9PEZI|nr:hypothetical protein K461DRAFT_317618 [Myriangium duriaei CBS 260.36]